MSRSVASSRFRALSSTMRIVTGDVLNLVPLL
jgi:hypothetical protein